MTDGYRRRYAADGHGSSIPVDASREHLFVTSDVYECLLLYDARAGLGMWV